MKMQKIKDLETRWQNHLMVTAAFRYCLGRPSYIVVECVRWLTENWSEFHEATRNKILEETAHALEHKEAGDICEAECWRALLDHLSKKAVS